MATAAQDSDFWTAVSDADRDARPYVAVRALMALCGTHYQDAFAELISDAMWDAASEAAGRGDHDADAQEVRDNMRNTMTPQQALAFFAAKLGVGK